MILVLISVSCEREVSVTPPDIPPANGSILIRSIPEEANIFMNGRDRRRLTPDSIKWLDTGDYEITLKKEFFRDTTFIVHVEEGEQSEIFVDYYSNPAMLGDIQCISLPAEAFIMIDDSITTHTTPYTFTDLIPGYHKIEYTMTDHRAVELNVAVASSETTIAQAALVDTTIWMDYNVWNNAIPTNTLTCILSASGPRGALWIGTYDTGLIKYVNGDWVKYDETNSAISDNQINCLEQDSMGNIWIGTMNGLTQIVPNILHTAARKDDDVTQWNFRNSPLLSMQINDVGISDGNNVWFATEIGIINLLISDSFYWGQPSSSSTSDLPDDRTTAFAVDGINKYVGTKAGGFVRFANPQNMTVYTTGNGLFRNSISAITIDDDGNAWVGHDAAIGVTGGLSKFNGVSWENLSHMIYGEDVNVIYVDSKNRKWIGTDRALYLITNFVNSGEFTYDNVGLNLSNVTGVTEDKDGIIWISTFGNGMFRMNVNNL
ncbi:two-component regulator propeller domain-containing protein [Bacteroidota bacterium]